MRLGEKEYVAFRGVLSIRGGCEGRVLKRVVRWR